MNTQQIAEAFSSHRFDEVYDRLDELVAWVVPGQEPIEGKAAVITTCTGAAAEFSGMATASFDRFVSVGNDSTVGCRRDRALQRPVRQRLGGFVCRHL